MQKIHYREWGIESPRYWGLLAVLGAIVAVAGFAVLHMEHEGHWVTGMSNQIVWGTPHVFAIFLIVAASGALNVASIGSVFGQTMYKPLARLSGLMAITLLVGGLLVLVLDLGQPSRLIVAMTTYNFKSIFAWNIYLYVGFMAIVVVYLFTMMERKANKYSKGVGVFAFVWRLALTTGTGSIFGFLVARQGYDAAIMAPMFIIMSFAYGLALYLLVLMFTFDTDDRPLGDVLLRRLKNLLGVFVAAIFYFTVVYHLTNLYGTENHAFEAFILRDGGVYTWTFWIGWVLLGMLVPMGILFHPALGMQRGAITLASLLVVLGGLSALYVIVIGGQAFPLNMFPGHTIVESGYYDGVGGLARHYSPTLPEFLLGVGGLSLALLVTFVSVRVMQFLPATLADEVTDPHLAK
uniref:Sulfur oxidation protein DsrP n=1 Tax=uncultured bacterium ws020C1 TaxID=1131823 RepID=I1X4I2_9BACT|nr:sulfur oxidation protein DsrP [uncultured bacterium ws020C1]